MDGYCRSTACTSIFKVVKSPVRPYWSGGASFFGCSFRQVLGKQLLNKKFESLVKCKVEFPRFPLHSCKGGHSK